MDTKYYNQNNRHNLVASLLKVSLLTFFILLYKKFWKTWAKTIAIPAINIRIESTPVLYTQQDFIIIVFTNCARLRRLSLVLFGRLSRPDPYYACATFMRIRIEAHIAHSSGHVDKVKKATLT